MIPALIRTQKVVLVNAVDEAVLLFDTKDVLHSCMYVHSCMSSGTGVPETQLRQTDNHVSNWERHYRANLYKCQAAEDESRTGEADVTNHTHLLSFSHC